MKEFESYEPYQLQSLGTGSNFISIQSITTYAILAVVYMSKGLVAIELQFLLLL